MTLKAKAPHDKDGGESVNTSVSALGTEEESSSETLPVKYHPIDTGWAWIIMIGVFVIHFLTTGYLRSFGLLFVEFQRNFQSSSTLTATMNGVQMLSYSLSTFITMNFWIKYVSVKTSCLVGCCVELLSVVGNSLVTDVTQLIFTHGVLFGIGQALIYCPSMVILSEYFDKKRPIATVIATGGVSAGGVIMPLLIRHVLETYGLEGGLLILAGVTFQQAVFVSLFTAPSEYGPASSGSDVASIGTIDGAAGNTYRGYTSEGGKTPVVDARLSVECEVAKQSPEIVVNGDHNNGKSTNGDVSYLQNNKQHGDFVLNGRTRCISSGDGATYQISPAINANQESGFCELSQSNREEQYKLLSPAYHAMSKPRCDSLLLPPSQTTPLHHQSNHEFIRKRPGRSNHPVYRTDDTLARALSTSSIDVLGSAHQLSVAGSMTSVRRRRTSTALSQNDTHHNQRPAESKERPFRLRRPPCRLPDMARRPAFWLVTLFFCCGGIASCLPVVFLPPLAKSLGLSEEQSSYFLVVSAIMEMLGRLVPGLILHFGYMRPSTVVIPSMVCCGILLQTVRLFEGFQHLLVLSGFIGCFTGAFWGMQVLVVIELIGMENLGPAFGFYSIVLGFSIGCGYPLTGALEDYTGGYIIPYHCFGVLYLLAALSMLIVQLLRSSEDNTDSLHDDDDNDDDDH